MGAAPLSLSTWQALTLAAILFHHSNVALPLRLERALCRILMTPRMHGIHHSVVADETNSNWSTIFSWPDYLHRTTRLGIAQDRISIGVPELRELSQVSFFRLLVLPWRMPLQRVSGTSNSSST